METQTGIGIRLEGLTIGQYRIGARIGRGGMGEVFSARDEKLRRRVAIKALPRGQATDPMARQRFLRETRLACKVMHPYVATVFDVLEHRGNLLLVMEYIEGRRFSDLIRARELSPAEISGYALEIVEALAAIHEQGLVHRDLKPSNVMITKEEHVKVMDFGVARSVAPGELDATHPTLTTEKTLTEDGLGVGTVQYMSPEQVRGQRVDQRSDLFSLGIVLYEAFSGKHPFARPTLLETASAILREDPGSGELPQTLTRLGPLADVVLRLLNKDPEERYQDSGTLIADLRSVLRGDEVPGLGRKTWRRAPVVGVVSALAVGGLLLWSLMQPDRVFRRSSVAGGQSMIVLPFAGPNMADETVQRGSVLASVLRADLSQSGLLNVLGSTRTDELSAGWPEAERTNVSERIDLMERASARYLVSCSFEDEAETTVVSVDVYDRTDPDRSIAFNVQESGTSGVVDLITRGLTTRLFPGRSVLEDASASAVTSSSDAALIAAERGRQALDRGDLAQAEQEYHAAVVEDPEYIQAYLERAKALYRAGYVTRAEQSVRQAEARTETFGRPLPLRTAIELQAVRGMVAEDREGEERARRSLVDAYRQDPRAWADLASAYAKATKYDEALVAIERAIRLRPNDPEFHLARARALRSLGRLDEMEQAIDRAEASATEFPRSHWPGLVAMQRGYLHSARKQYDEARVDYEAAAAVFVEAGQPLLLAEAQRAVAQTWLRQGEYSRSIPPLEKAAEDFTAVGNLRRAAVSLDTLGAVLFTLGDHERAESVLRTALDYVERTEGRQPSVTSLINLAGVLNRTGRSDEALRLARRALEIATLQNDTRRQGTALLAAAVAEKKLGRLEDAERQYRRVLELLEGRRPDERLGWAWDGVTGVRRDLGRLAAALEASEHALEEHRASNQRVNTAYSRTNRLQLFRMAGDRDAFHDELRQIEKLFEAGGERPPELDARIRLERGLQSFEDGELQEAERALRSVWSMPDADPSLITKAGAALGSLLCRTSREEDGIEVARAAVAGAGSVIADLEARVSLALCMAGTSRFSESRAEALRATDDAESRGILWQQVRAGAVALALPASERPSSEHALRARSAAALDRYLDDAPGGREGPIAGRTEVRWAREVLERR